MSRGDLTNPHADLPEQLLLPNKHYVADVAAQQDGVPQASTVHPRETAQRQSNLPTDYDTLSAVTAKYQQSTTNSQETTPKQIAAVPSSSSQNTGETDSVPLQDGNSWVIVHLAVTHSIMMLPHN